MQSKITLALLGALLILGVGPLLWEQTPLPCVAFHSRWVTIAAENSPGLPDYPDVRARKAEEWRATARANGPDKIETSVRTRYLDSWVPAEARCVSLYWIIVIKRQTIANRIADGTITW